MSSSVIGSISNSVLSILFPELEVCVYCGAEYKTINQVCPDCKLKLQDITAKRDKAFGFEFFACYNYEGMARSIVQRYKYDYQKYLAKYIACAIADTIDKNKLKGNIIVHVPLHEKKKKQRGFCQSELAAKKLAELTGQEHVFAIKRTRYTKTQTKLTKEQRIRNVKNAFEIIRQDRIKDKRVILIDDVMTTGSTSAECARELIKHGAKNVVVLVFAKALSNY